MHALQHENYLRVACTYTCFVAQVIAMSQIGPYRYLALLIRVGSSFDGYSGNMEEAPVTAGELMISY